jgi:soluble cytochrome b562
MLQVEEQDDDDDGNEDAGSGGGRPAQAAASAKKTKAERNRLKRRQEADAVAAQRRGLKRQRVQIDNLKRIAAQLEVEAAEKAASRMRRQVRPRYCSSHASHEIGFGRQSSEPCDMLVL